MKYFIYYLLGINLLSFICYGVDKKLAKGNKTRISERTLFYFSFFGGCLGCLVGMFLFRHKTKKVKFYLWNFFMLIVWIYLIYSFWR